MSAKKPPNAGKGRVRGVPNRTTATVRDVLTAFVEQNAASAQALYDRVSKRNPAKALEIFARIAEFVLPRLQRTELRLPSAPLPNEVTDPNEAAAVYSRIMGDPSLDITDVQFSVPTPQQFEPEPLPALVEHDVVPSDLRGLARATEPPLTELQQRLKTWEALGK